MSTFGLKEKKNIYWYVMGKEVLGELWSGLLKTSRDVPVCLLASKKKKSKSRKRVTKDWEELLVFICSIWSNPNTVGVIFSPSLSHHPSLHERTAPHCSPDNFGKGVRWDEEAQKGRWGQSIENFAWVLKGWVVLCWGREEFNSCELVFFFYLFLLE